MKVKYFFILPSLYRCCDYSCVSLARSLWLFFFFFCVTGSLTLEGCISLWIWLTFHREQRAGAPVSRSLAHTPKVCSAHLLECSCLYTQGGHLLVLSSTPFAVEVPGCRVMDESQKKASASDIYSLICWYSPWAILSWKNDTAPTFS